MTRIVLNGRDADVPFGKVSEIVDSVLPGGYAVVDGFGSDGHEDVREGMQVFVFSKTAQPSADEYEALLSARDSPGVYAKMKRARVGIAGLGGLGSNISVMLARAGVGYLKLVDRDVVDITNLNRQDYRRDDIGRRKTDAIADRIASITPFVETEKVFATVTQDNATCIFGDCDIVVEAFDGAENKAMLITTILSETDKWVVSGNGMAGFGPSNTIVTSSPMRHLVMCGDCETSAGPGCGLMSPRVTVAAAHQANAVMRLILGKNPVEEDD